MTENDRIKFKDEIERIVGIPTERIYNLDFKKLQKLTADFKEPLVKLILSKIKTCEGQTEMLRFLKNKYEEELFFIGVPTSEISAPEYFSSLEFDLECNRLITIEGIVSAPVLYPIESPSDEKSGTEVKERKWLKLYNEKTSTPPDISQLMARIEELEAENKELKKTQTILKEVEEQEEKEQQVSTGEDTSKLQAENEKLKAELEELREQVGQFRKKEKGTALGLNQGQAALFGLAMANSFGFNYTNKKKELAPMLHKLFGWGEGKLQNCLSSPCTKEERNELAKLFVDLCPKLHDTIMNWGENPPGNTHE